MSAKLGEDKASAAGATCNGNGFTLHAGKLGDKISEVLRGRGLVIIGDRERIPHDKLFEFFVIKFWFFENSEKMREHFFIPWI